MSNVYLGEVVASALSSWVVQAWQWEKFPEFGSIVRLTCGEYDMFGIVSDIKTGSDDKSRQPFAYQKTELELRRDQPQIFEFLKTNFTCLPVGYCRQGVWYYTLPSRPPRTHAFVAVAAPQELTLLCQGSGLLQALFSHAHRVESFEELLLAVLRQLREHGLLTQELLMQLMEYLALLWASDYRRLKFFMDRIDTPFYK